MGLIREPRDVDFYVIDKPWTEQEKKEFSELIKKEKSRTRIQKLKKKKRKTA